MITEIATFQLASPANLSDPSPPTTRTIHTFLTAVLATDGAHAAFFGQSVEKPDTVIIFIDWDSTDAHHWFLASPTHAPLLSPLSALTNPTSPPQILHLPPIPHPLLGSHPTINIAEIVLSYFPSSLTAEDTADFMARMEKLRPVLEASEAGGVFEGWAEEGGVVYGDQEGGCRVWVNVVGWEGVEAHGRMTGSEAFREGMEAVMGMERLRGVEMFHARLVRV